MRDDNLSEERPVGRTRRHGGLNSVSKSNKGIDLINHLFDGDPVEVIEKLEKARAKHEAKRRDKKGRVDKKEDLIAKALAQQGQGVSKKETAFILNAIVEEVFSGLKEGKTVEISSRGAFVVEEVVGGKRKLQEQPWVMFKATRFKPGKTLRLEMVSLGN